MTRKSVLLEKRWMGLHPYRPLGRRPMWAAPAERQHSSGMRTAREREQHSFLVIINKVSNLEYIGVRSEPGELKHLSTQRKGHQTRLR